MAVIDETGFLIGKAIEWAGVVTNETTGDAEFVMRFTDGSACTIGASQRDGFPLEMSVDEISNQQIITDAKNTKGKVRE